MHPGLRFKRLTVCLGLLSGHLIELAACSKRATQNRFNSRMRALRIA